MSRFDSTSLGATAALLAVSVFSLACGANGGSRDGSTSVRESTDASTRAAGLKAWDSVYRVLQHPRCANCHPSGDSPLQGDDGRVHAQNVVRGLDGEGRYALRCDACHQAANLDGPHLPPGAPHWRLPSADMPLVFQGRSSAELARQVRDPARNGGKSPQQLVDHVARDPFVLWAWAPGEGRTTPPISHADFVKATEVWAASGCVAPDR